MKGFQDRHSWSSNLVFPNCAFFVETFYQLVSFHGYKHVVEFHDNDCEIPNHGHVQTQLLHTKYFKLLCQI